MKKKNLYDQLRYEAMKGVQCIKRGQYIKGEQVHKIEAVHGCIEAEKDGSVRREGETSSKNHI